jgi:hypothetical protein
MTEPKTTCEDPSFNLSKEDTAFFIRNLWEALITPTWTRDDIIELGKAVFAKVPLSKLDDKRFDQLLPYLTKMSENLALKIHARLMSEQEAMLAASKSAAVSSSPESNNPPPKDSPPEIVENKPTITIQSSTEMTSAPASPPAEPSNE